MNPNKTTTTTEQLTKGWRSGDDNNLQQSIDEKVQLIICMEKMQLAIKQSCPLGLQVFLPALHRCLPKQRLNSFKVLGLKVLCRHVNLKKRHRCV